MSWYGAAKGAALGLVLGNVPGAIAGGYYGYNTKKKLPKNFRMQATANYPTPTTGSRKRKLSISAGGNRFAKKLFLGKPKRLTINQIPLRLRGGRRRGVRKRFSRSKFKPKRSSGPYTGAFPKGEKNRMTKETKYLSLGYHKTIEQYGNVDDPDCVHILHSTANVVETCRAIGGAALRKLLTKAGFKVTNPHVPISASDPPTGALIVDSSAGLKFVYTTREQGTGLFVNYHWDSPAGSILSFGGLLGGFVVFTDKLIEYIRDNTGIHEPYKLAVYKADFNAVNTHWRLGAELALEDLKLDIGWSSHLVVQNRTKAALTAEGDQNNLDRVDAQPLKGYIYDFKHGEPRVKHSGNPIDTSGGFSNQAFNMVKEEGMTLIRGAQFIPANEPMVPKYWQNCDKNVQVVMQPGEMKKLSFVHQFKGTWLSFFKKMKAVGWVTIGGGTFYTGIAGKCQMISLEELMRTPSTNKVSLAYERELKIGCFVTEKKYQAPFETVLVPQEYSNTV